MSRALDTLQKIKNELMTDPLSVGYAGKDAGTRSILMNTPISQSPVVFIIGAFDPQEIVHILVKQGKWQGILTSADVNAKNLVALTNLGNISLSPDETAIKTMISNLVTLGLLSNSDVTALKAGLTTEIKLSRADALSLGVVSQGDVEQALLV